MVKLVVGNLPPSATNQSLKEIFHNYDDLQDYKLISNYGFVYLESEQSANHAVHSLNGLEYRGFQVTVDFVGDSRIKRKMPIAEETNNFPKVVVPAQKRLATPQLEQRNPNPYNLAFANTSNGTTRNFEVAPDKRFTQPIPPSEARNPNPYNLPIPKTKNTAQKNFNLPTDNRFGQPQFDDYTESAYGPTGYEGDYGGSHGDGYGASSQYNDFSGQYIPEDEYFSNMPPAKRPRGNTLLDNDKHGYAPRKPTDNGGYGYTSRENLDDGYGFAPRTNMDDGYGYAPHGNMGDDGYAPRGNMGDDGYAYDSRKTFDDEGYGYAPRGPMDNSGYGYGLRKNIDTEAYGFPPRKSMNFIEDEFRPFRPPQPSWVDKRQMPNRQSYLHSRDEPFYRPRGKMIYQPTKSYINEYEDDRDYGEADPYPAYLKQYKK